jgi:hypothetical protein
MAVVGRSTGDRTRRELIEEIPDLIHGEADEVRRFPKIPLQEISSILRRESVWGGQASHDGIRLHQYRGRKDQLVSAPEQGSETLCGGFVVLVPGQKGRDHDARVDRRRGHSILRAAISNSMESLADPFRGQGRGFFPGNGDMKAALLDDPNLSRSRLDLDPSLAQSDPQGDTRTDSRLLPDGLGHDQPARRINGNIYGIFHGMYFTMIGRAN